MSDVLEIKDDNNKVGEGHLKENKKHKKRSRKDSVILGLSVATGILGLITLGLWIGFATAQTQANEYKENLESVYQNNFYSLLDNVNNLDNKLSKIVNSSSSNFQRKTLIEAAKNASEAEIAVASLPLSHSDIQDMVRMVNQISGYASTLSEKLIDGRLSESDYKSLNDVYYSVHQLKINLNDFARKLDNGYSIIDGAVGKQYETNDFTLSMSSSKDNNIEYPSMIYDGPFSDSVVYGEIKGLKGDKMSKGQASENLQKYFKNASSVEYESETNGRFDTYNFRVYNSDDEILFVQVSQIGGYILTISGAGENGKSTIDKDDAKQIALNFASENGIENPEVVWSDNIDNDIYFNITPTQNGVVLYPDLVKVKINMTSGTVIGYDSTSYFTNHTARVLNKGNISYSLASGKIPSSFDLVSHRIVLAPLDYNREMVCVEIEAREDDSTYYFYFNSETGELENVLKVIETDDGNLLM